MLNEVPAPNGFNSFYLSSFEAFDDSPDKWQWLKNPVIYFDDSTTIFIIKKFYPGEVDVDYNSNTNNRLTLLQANYKGWQILVDSTNTGIEEKHHLFISCMAPAGRHEVKFVYQRPLVKFLFFLSQILLAGTFLYLAVTAVRGILLIHD